MFIHISTNQIAKVHCNAFLSESVSRNLSLGYHFGGDSTLDSWIANVRGCSKHRFRQRLWSVCVKQNQNDFHQFSWSPTDILFSNSKSWFYSCHAGTSRPCWHSLIHFGKPPQHKGKKTHTIAFSGQKFHLQLVIGQMAISQLWEKPSYL